MCTDEPHCKEEKVSPRKRLMDVEEQIDFFTKFSATGEAKASAYADLLRAEKEDNHGKLQAPMPMHAKLQTMSNRLKAAENGQTLPENGWRRAGSSWPRCRAARMRPLRPRRSRSRR